MQVADIRAPLQAVPTPERGSEGNRSIGRTTDGGRESAITPYPQAPQPGVYGELLPRTSGLAPKSAVDLPRPAANRSGVYPSHAAVSHLSHQRAIDIYQTLQAHATAQVLSPVYRIDLYA